MKESKELFNRKTNRYLNAVNQLLKDKNIRIKITPHMEKLADHSKDNTDDVKKALAKYRLESMAFCGNSYEYFPSLYSFKTTV
jgi:hypothetical protein